MKKFASSRQHKERKCTNKKVVLEKKKPKSRSNEPYVNLFLMLCNLLYVRTYYIYITLLGKITNKSPEFNPILTGCCHLIFIYELIPSSASRNRVKGTGTCCTCKDSLSKLKIILFLESICK